MSQQRRRRLYSGTLGTRTNAEALLRETSTTSKETHSKYQYCEHWSDWQKWLYQNSLTQVAQDRASHCEEEMSYQLKGT